MDSFKYNSLFVGVFPIFLGELLQKYYSILIEQILHYQTKLSRG